jgi:hypothetical protein
MTRSVDSWEAAEQAAAAGMRAILVKDHHTSTISQAYIINKHLKKDNFDIFGCICLNNSMGGLNPYAVDAAVKFGGKLIYFPTVSAERHIELFQNPQDFVPTKEKPLIEVPVRVTDEQGNVKPEARQIIEMIAGADIILSIGHLGYDETYALVKAAVEMGTKKISLTHLPLFTCDDKEKLKKIVDIGGYVEMVYQVVSTACPENMRYTPEKFADYIRFFGVDRCYVATDGGQLNQPVPLEVYKNLIKLLIDQGFSDNEIEVLTKTNPAKLLGIR